MFDVIGGLLIAAAAGVVLVRSWVHVNDAAIDDLLSEPWVDPFDPDDPRWADQ